jgi:hypothetical protein
MSRIKKPLSREQHETLAGMLWEMDALVEGAIGLACPALFSNHPASVRLWKLFRAIEAVRVSLDGAYYAMDPTAHGPSPYVQQTNHTKGE